MVLHSSQNGLEAKYTTTFSTQRRTEIVPNYGSHMARERRVGTRGLWQGALKIPINEKTLRLQWLISCITKLHSVVL